MQRYVTIFALVFQLVVNIAAITWGAARLSSSVDQLKEIVTPLAIEVHGNTNDIAVLKDRFQRGMR